MTKYREILRLNSQGISQRSIAASCSCSRNTVAKVLQRASEMGISWPLEKNFSDGELNNLLFPESNLPNTRKHPDYEAVHKEMAKSGVTLTLLWYEYCESCRQSNEIPLMYSQFCYHYQQYTRKTKATMHIHRKPGEQTEVDWAGQKAQIIDRDTGEIIEVSIFEGYCPAANMPMPKAFCPRIRSAG